MQARMAVDLYDKGDAYIVEAELPGVKRSELDVRVGDHGQSLVIEAKAESRSWKGEEQAQGM